MVIHTYSSSFYLPFVLIILFVIWFFFFKFFFSLFCFLKQCLSYISSIEWPRNIHLTKSLLVCEINVKVFGLKRLCGAAQKMLSIDYIYMNKRNGAFCCPYIYIVFWSHMQPHQKVDTSYPYFSMKFQLYPSK